MNLQLKKRLIKTIVYLAIGFGVLFIFRLMYGYHKTSDYVSYQGDFFESIMFEKKNYATEKYVKKSNNTHSSQKIDQKYEKIAEIRTKSTEFDKEEKLTREKIALYKALIQFEQKSGNKGERRLSLLIGVPPENFDQLYKDLSAIGIVQAKEITKKDKTNEYKELNAKKSSLEKIRSSLIELKSKGGKIDEYMNLENRILEIEQDLQDLGVSLGDFDDENEFCTVQFALSEGKVVKISLIHRIKVALEWTIKFYLRIMVTLFFMSLFAYLLLRIVDRLKIITKLIDKK